MSGLMSLLNSELGNQIVGNLSQTTGVDQNKTADVMGMAMPLIMGALKKNAQSPEGAQGIMNALSNKHDGSVLNKLESLLGGGELDGDLLQDGAGILGHVFGGNQPQVENALSQQSGLDVGTISQMLKVAAPIALGVLGREARNHSISGSSDLNALLGSMLGGQPAQNKNLITSLIDQDGDGSVLDDVADMVMGVSSKKGGLGGLLSGFFGKR